MSDRPLPADMASWPSSPHQLLGVGPGYGARELKKAYTRLIRFYKPELHPQEFARIRGAYDALLPWAAAEAKELPPPAAEEPPPPPVFDARLPMPARVAEADDWWQDAVAGRPEPAYDALAEETARRPTAERNYLRLYWLLSARRDLDPDRHPADWLARGLSACPGSARLAETYATHLTMHPLEAGTPRCEGVVAGLADPQQLALVVRHVWLALLRRRQWAEVRAQFPAVKARMGLGTEAWLGLIRTASDHAGWAGAGAGGDLMRDCLRELDELGHVALGRPELFDRIDFLQTLARVAAATRRDAGLVNLAGLLRRAWAADLDAVRGELHELVADMAAHPNRWANRFDDGGAAAAVLAFQGFQLVGQLWAEYAAPPPPRELAGSVPAELAPLPYPHYRNAVCRFCLATYTPPEVIVATLAPRYAAKFPQQAPLEELILNDWPLRLVCLAHRFFHS